MNLLLLGATGLVGGHVLDLALGDPRIMTVTAPVRRAVPDHAKLRAPRIDFEHLPDDAGWWRADAVICALGTTRRAAGSAEAFRHVDHDLVLAALRLARTHGTATLALVSAAGANERSPFLYQRTKGEVEREATALAFPSLTILRPGLIGGERREHRLGERLALAVSRTAQPILPIAWRINPATRIAERLLAAAVAGLPGRYVVRSSELTAGR